MSKQNFLNLLTQEVSRLDEAKTAKRSERIIEGFTSDPAPKAIIGGKNYHVFNSNDYLGLRHHPLLKEAEHQASQTFGTGPGAVRFISGSLSIHRQLEQALAKFHQRDDAMIFSSAFATNMAVMFCLITGQAKDTVVTNDVLVISDALNHRSIIDGIRIANLPKDQRAIMNHLDASHLETLLKESLGKFSRVLVITDGVFSMLGEYQHLKEIKSVIDQYDAQYPQGILLVVDDAHGVGIAGHTGRGVEEVEGVQADVLIGTMGKAFGADGGYVVANQSIINYLRESAATYIYSNSISPGTAGAALAAVTLLDQPEGQQLLQQSRDNIAYFKKAISSTGIELATDSSHAIQPVLMGNPAKAAQVSQNLFDQGILATKITYPVVPQGRDEIRIQISATHTKEDLNYLLTTLTNNK